MFGLKTLARVAGEIRRDVAAAHQRDPAARGVSSTEILTSWPGVHALLTHRVAHALHGAGIPVMPRALAYGSRAITGIEIHPAARIGRGLFIDHGSGVVIGETAEIGDDVTIYQSVTLGGTNPTNGIAGKRHPTLLNGVIVGSGAQVLGPITVGAGARIGANSVVTKDVPDGATMTGIPARALMVDSEDSGKPFMPYGTPCSEMFDPQTQKLEILKCEVDTLRARLEQLMAERDRSSAHDRAAG